MSRSITVPKLGFVTVAGLVLAGVGASPVMASVGEVLSHQKISDTEGGFAGTLDISDFFGISVVSPGDLDGDGVGDLATVCCVDRLDYRTPG